MTTLLPLLLLAAAPAERLHAIPTEAAARAVCAATQPIGRTRPGEPGVDERKRRRRAALAGTYEAVIPAHQLPLDDVDEAARELVFKRPGVLRPGAGVQLFVEDDEVVVTASASLPERGLAAAASRVAAQERATFRLRYALGELAGAGPCAAPKPGTTPVIAVEPLRWELVDEAGTVVASGVPEGVAERRAPPGGTPSVAVEPATVDGEGPPASAVTQKAKDAAPRLQGCFQGALEKEPALDGSVVFRVDIGADGRAKAVDVTADSVASDGLVACAKQVLVAIEWGKGGPSSALVPVHFERK